MQYTQKNLIDLALRPERQIAVTSKIKTSMAPNPIILRYHFGNFGIEGLTYFTRICGLHVRNSYGT